MARKNSVAAEIREEQKKALKDMSLKKKLAYFWEYYKIHTIVFISVTAIIFSLTRSILNAKDQAFYAMMINAYGMNGEFISEDFAAYAGVDTDQYHCNVDTSSTLSLDSFTPADIGTLQKIMAYTQVGDLDVMVADSGVFARQSENEMFMDIRKLLSEDKLSAYEDHLFYVDMAVIAAKNAAAPTEPPQMTAAEQAAALEIHRHPEAMKEPIPVGIFLTESAFMKSTGFYPSEYFSPPVFGVTVSTQQPENALLFLEYLWTTDMTEYEG